MSLEEEQICAVQDDATEQAMRRLRRVYKLKKHEIPKIREVQRGLFLVQDQDVICSVPRKSLLQIHDCHSQYARAVCLPDRWARIILGAGSYLLSTSMPAVLRVCSIGGESAIAATMRLLRGDITRTPHVLPPRSPAIHSRSQSQSPKPAVKRPPILTGMLAGAVKERSCICRISLNTRKRRSMT